MMMKVVCASETSVHTYQTVQRHIAQNGYCHSHHHENLKSHKYSMTTYKTAAE